MYAPSGWFDVACWTGYWKLRQFNTAILLIAKNTDV